MRTIWHVDGEDTCCVAEALDELGRPVARVTIRAERMVGDDRRFFVASEEESAVEAAAEALLTQLVDR